MAKFEFESQMEIYKKLLKEAEKYEKSSRYEQALSIYLNAEKIAKKYGSKIERGNLIHRKGRVLARKGNLSDALNAFKRSLKFLKKGGANALQFANINEAIGDAYKINGLNLEALSAYQDSLKILNDENERVVYTHSHLTTQILEATAKQLIKIGEIHLVLGNIDKALKCSREGLKISLDIKSSSMILKSRLSVAKILSEKEDYKTSLEYLLKSQDLAKENNDTDSLVNILLEIANIYQLDENYKTALRYYKKALKLSEKSANNYLVIQILYKIGVIYLEKNSKKKSLEFFQKSYEKGKQLDQYYCDFTLYQLGVVHSLYKNYEIAYETLKDSLKLAKINNNRNLLSKVLVKIGDIWKIRNNYDDAIYYYKKALENVTLLISEADILNKIGIVNLLCENFEDAKNYFTQSYFLLQTLLLVEPNSNNRKLLVENLFEVTRNFCAFKCALYKNTQNKMTLKEALGFADFQNFFNNSNHLINSLITIKSSSSNKIQTQTNQELEKIKELINKYRSERDQNSKKQLISEIKETNRSIQELVEKYQESEIVIEGNYLETVGNRFDVLFEIDTESLDSFIILDFIYIQSIETVYIFTIDMKNNDVLIFSKKVRKSSVRTIQNKLKKLQAPNIKQNKVKFNKLMGSLSNLWNKLVPKSLTKLLTSHNYEKLTVVAHYFLAHLPWEKMLIKKQEIRDLFRFQQRSSLFSVIKNN